MNKEDFIILQNKLEKFKKIQNKIEWNKEILNLDKYITEEYSEQELRILSIKLTFGNGSCKSEMAITNKDAIYGEITKLMEEDTKRLEKELELL